MTPPIPGKPLVSSDYLDFGSVAETLTFTLSNAGEQPFDFRVLSSRGWLSATPYTGRVVKGSSVAVTVVVDRAAASADGGEGGFLAVNTTAGHLRVGANVSMEMTGSWTGSLRVTTPVDLGDHALVVNVRQTGGALFGWVDAERSPLYPLEMAVTGSVFSDPAGDAVSFSFDLPSPASRRDLNPAFPKDIIRHFIFTGTRTGPASLTGTFVESFDGIVDNLQVKLSGEATFSRSGVMAKGEADEAPVATLTLAGNPMIGTDGSLTEHYASCENGSSAALGNARSYILATESGRPKLALYQSFWQAVQARRSPYDCADSPEQCAAPFDPQSLHCAQYWAWRGLPGEADVGGSLFLDALEVAADHALYLGNEQVVRALDAWYSAGGAFEDQIKLLEEAEQTYVSGLHSPDQSGPLALLDPFNATVLSTLPAAADAQSNGSSLKDSPVSDETPRRNGEHVRRALGVVDGALFAGTRRADLQRRMALDADSAKTARTAAVRAWIDIAALAPALATSPVTWKSDVESVRNNLGEAVRRYTEIEWGHNMFGYAPVYVPFLWKYTGTELGTNYNQIKAQADLARSTWQALYGEAASAQRDFEANTSGMRTELSNQLSAIGMQIGDLCGVNDIDDQVQCGKNGTGRLVEALLDIESAAMRMVRIENQLTNLVTAIRIEEDRASAIGDLHRNQAILITKTGEKVYLEDKTMRELTAAQQATHSFLGGILGGLSSGNPYAALGAMVIGGLGAAVDMAANGAREDHERHKADLLTYQQAQTEYVAMNGNLVDSAARVKTMALEFAILEIDHDIARLELSQARKRLDALWIKAGLLISDRTRVKELSDAKADYAIHHRVFANTKMRRAAESMDQALEWTYLATRALEYQLATSYAGWSRLWGVRDPSDLLDYLTTLQGFAAKQRTSQSYRDVISLRDDILRVGETVRDECTGREITPRERFRIFMADPANRDLDGNLRITFSTDGPESVVSSRSVCSDRIQSVAVNLIGDSLGAGLRRRAGTSWSFLGCKRSTAITKCDLPAL